MIKFFEIKSSAETSDGYGLLNVVNLLSSGPVQLVEIMATQCSLPSRLVMCLYLFICLPEAKDSILDYSSEFSATERRILFQKSFQQVNISFHSLFSLMNSFHFAKLLTKLCNYSSTFEELADSDSLKLLFTIISSICDTYNIAWRRSASDALATLSKTFTPKTIQYIHRMYFQF